ncbi:DUF2155 domain-containing protein [Mesobacterium sp. TK19101]|uniref:DUF2155 domain-containing protein n=1 Tax=Mesobacterium hydrothermale TaxID=3111907 RepID=A0ABU6HDD4_9RHOB|nr:DUF2155 domain-containing protein [Mesobacterium sp. TK19101]MEC3860401.1 DUF2155 domain-containing protein [Mesobacterium sp. TK19101]
MIRGALIALFAMALPAVAQEQVNEGTGARLRALDKLTGHVEDLVIVNGGTQAFGRIRVALRECRYPEGNPAGDAYAFVTVTETGKDVPVFSGWIVASSPALNAMDHPRYDIWALACTTS